MTFRPITNRTGHGVLAIFFALCAITFVSCGGEAPSTDSDSEMMEQDADNAQGQADQDNSANHDNMEQMDSMQAGELKAGSAEATIQEFIANGTGTMVVILDKIPFEGEDLSDEANAQLDALAEILKNNPDLNIEIQGHTTQAKNAVGATSKKTMSGARALWVKTKLTLRGAAASQMDANGYGDEMLLPELAPDDEAQKRIAIAMSK